MKIRRNPPGFEPMDSWVVPENMFKSWSSVVITIIHQHHDTTTGFYASIVSPSLAKDFEEPLWFNYLLFTSYLVLCNSESSTINCLSIFQPMMTQLTVFWITSKQKGRLVVAALIFSFFNEDKTFSILIATIFHFLSLSGPASYRA